MKQVNFKNGIGEVLEMAIIIPILLVALLLIINLFQFAICEEKLIYAAYMGGREAVISFDYDTAVKNATKKLDDIFQDDPYDFSISPNTIEWEKGNVALIQVGQNFNPIFIYGRGYHTRQLGMMIEHSNWVTLH